MSPSPVAREHPAWFGAVMATAGLALIAEQEALRWGWPVLRWLAVALLLLATLLALTLWPGYLRRLADPAALRAEIADAARGPLLATLPAGLLLLAAAWGTVGARLLPPAAADGVDLVLLAVGALVAVAYGVVWMAGPRDGTAGLAQVNGGWLIPVVMYLLVAVAVAPVVPGAGPWAAPLLVLGWVFVGIGVFLFLPIFTLLVARVALFPPEPAALAPTTWIPLAPAGILGVATLHLLQAGDQERISGSGGILAGVVVAAMGLGLGLWWALLAGLRLRRARRAAQVPFHPGWWAFVFPVVALDLSVLAIAAQLRSLPLELAGAAGSLIAAGLWLMVAVRSLAAARYAARQRQNSRATLQETP